MLCAGLPLLGAASAPGAEMLRPVAGTQADLGEVSVLAYYVPAAGGFHLVATAQTAGADPIVMRFETTLQSGQDATISVPRAAGQPPIALVFHRRGDMVQLDRPVVTN